MAPKHYENIKDASLSTYISADYTRLVAEPLRNFNRGYSEIPLEIQLQPETAAMLSFDVPWDGGLYGFVRGKESLGKKLGLTLPLQSVTLSDWNGTFALIFETEKAEQTAAFRVSKQDVLELLESCRRPPEMGRKA